MNQLLKWLATLAAALFASAALAQAPRATFAQPELDQMLAPIALYPDSLLSQMLMAATFPRDVAEAASWSRAQGGLRGEQAVRAAENEPWDPSVISLTAFPDVLAMMDERREWTARLGDAFLAQPDQVMDSVQELRRRADEAGSLRSSEELVVERQGEDYVIEPPTPDYFYVPYYDPRVAYGNWWWSDWPPVYWNPWPGYSYRNGFRGFGWGPRLYLGGGFFFGAFDWGHRYVRYSSHRPWYYRGHDYRGGYRWTRGRDGRDGHGGGRDWRNARDGRNGRDQGAGPRRATSSPAGRANAPASAGAQGFFRPEQARRTAPDTPRYGAQRAADGERAGTVRSHTVPRASPVERGTVQRPMPTERAYAPRSAPTERAYTPRAAPIERQAPQRSAPTERAYTPRAAPVERARSQPAPVERAAVPSRSPVERAAPRENSDRGDSSRDSSPASRGRGRDR